MDNLNYTEFRNRLASVMDSVCQDHAPVIVTRRNAKPVVILSLEDFSAYEETAYLLNSAENARRLTTSLDDAAAGRLVNHVSLNDLAT
jgi:antitoxin YefM